MFSSRVHVYRIEPRMTETIEVRVDGLEAIRKNDIFIMRAPEDGKILPALRDFDGNSQGDSAVYGLATDNGFTDPSMGCAQCECDSFDNLTEAVREQTSRMKVN